MLPDELVRRIVDVGARAVQSHGIHAQLVQLAEEATELALAAHHVRREKVPTARAVEELADTIVVGIGALATLDPAFAARLVSVIEQKLDRLEERLGARERFEARLTRKP